MRDWDQSWWEKSSHCAAAGARNPQALLPPAPAQRRSSVLSFTRPDRAPPPRLATPPSQRIRQRGAAPALRAAHAPLQLQLHHSSLTPTPQESFRLATLRLRLCEDALHRAEELQLLEL